MAMCSASGSMKDTEKAGSRPDVSGAERQHQPRLPVPRLVQLAAISAVLVASKELMNSLPNIHPVSLILILCTRAYGWQAMYAAVVFIVSQALLHGFGIWFFSYLYIWPLLVGLVMLFRRNDGRLFWALFAGSFGLLFGALCAVPYLFIGSFGETGGAAGAIGNTGGIGAALAYWVAGIPFDLLHGTGNFVLTLAAMKPLERLLARLNGS